MKFFDERFSNWIAELKMHISVPNSLVLVEGHAFVKVFSTFFVKEVKILSSIGLNHRANIFRAITTISSKNIIGIVDAEFLRINNERKFQYKNLFFTDMHDLSTQIFFSRAFDRFIKIFALNTNIDINKLRNKCLKI